MSLLPTDSCAMLLSVKPEFAWQILEGSKRVELRRQIPRFEVGGLVILYASSPQKAVVGAFTLSEVEVDEPDLLWRRVESISGLALDDYRSYFSGAEQAVGLHVGRYWKFETPLLLGELREAWPGFSPPQSFRYIRWSEDGGVVSLHLEGRSAGPLQLTA